MIYRIQARLARNWAELQAHPERGDTVEKILWIAVTIGVVTAVGALFRAAIIDYFQSLVFSVGA